MNIKIYEQEVPLSEITEISKEFYYPMIKGVVDIEHEIVAFGGEYHMDANLVLLDTGLLQSNIWGFNLLIDKLQKNESEYIEYTSLINIRPQVGNRFMEIEDAKIREKIKLILDKKIKK
jgi:hypothetical protein